MFSSSPSQGFVGASGSVLDREAAARAESLELHLLEAISLITSFSPAFLYTGQGQGQGGSAGIAALSMQASQEDLTAAANWQAAAQQQQVVLQQTAAHLVGQLQEVLRSPHMDRYAEQLAAVAAHKISCLASLSKGHVYSLTAGAGAGQVSADVFLHVTAVVAEASELLSIFASMRAKVFVFLHRMVSVLGPHLLPPLLGIATRLLQHSDGSDVEELVKVLNNVMLQHRAQTVTVIAPLLRPILSKISLLAANFEMELSMGGATMLLQPAGRGQGQGQGQEAAPVGGLTLGHILGERANFQLMFVLLLQHVVEQVMNALQTVIRIGTEAVFLLIFITRIHNLY